MKKFKKLELLEFLGLLNARFNYETLQFEESFKCRFGANLRVFLLITSCFKYYLSKFWPREHLIQLYIGSVAALRRCFQSKFLIVYDFSVFQVNLQLSASRSQAVDGNSPLLVYLGALN